MDTPSGSLLISINAFQKLFSSLLSFPYPFTEPDWLGSLKVFGIRILDEQWYKSLVSILLTISFAYYRLIAKLYTYDPHIKNTFFIAFMSSSSLDCLAKLTGQHFIIPTIESVNAKNESTWPSPACFKAVLIDMGSLLYVNTTHDIVVCACTY